MDCMMLEMDCSTGRACQEAGRMNAACTQFGGAHHAKKGRGAASEGMANDLKAPRRARG